MNFFKSIILDDPEPPTPDSPRESSPEEGRSPIAAAQGGGDADGWSFGSLIKTLATRSESVIETYSRDLKEFGTGLRKESEIIREVASRAVKELPASLEAGTTAAHGVLDGVLKSTAEIISKEPQFSDGESETPEVNRSLNSGRYSRFEAQLSAIQTDLNTFCEEPDESEDYAKWKSSFKLDERSGEIEGLIGENGVLDANFRKIVPDVVDHDTFWCRYFYRVDKLEQQEKARAILVKRAMSVDEDDDELSWDVDEDEEKEKEKDGEKAKDTSDDVIPTLGEKGGSLSDGSQLEKQEKGNANMDDGVKKDSVEAAETSNEGEATPDEVAGAISDERLKSEETNAISDERLKSEETNEVKNDKSVGADEGEAGEKGKVAEASKHEAKTEEEEMGWDEIEDTGSDNEKKVSISERPNREELRKQLSSADDDEDLSWDIEDDDEPVKS